MKPLRRAWQAVGFAGDLSFLLATLGLAGAAASIATGLLATLTKIETVFVIIAGVCIFCVLVAVVPRLLARIWPALRGPELVIGEWTVNGRLGTDGIRTIASVGVWNGRDAGGERACARGVVPQLEVFTPDGVRVYHHVGWENGNQRDFPATREEERLQLATKKGDETHYLLGSCPPLFASQIYYLEGRLTLRGANLSRPLVATFSLGLDPNGELWLTGN